MSTSLNFSNSKLLIIIYLLLGIFVSFYPVIICLVFEIWPPTTMVAEVFGTNYLTYWILKTTYHMIGAGHAFHLLFAFPANWIVDLAGSDLTNHGKFFLFSMALYGVHGLMVFSILIVAAFASLNWVEKYILLIVPLAPAFLERETNFDLMINYQKGEEVIYLLVAFLLMLWISQNWKYDLVRSALLGVLTATAGCIKFSMLVTVGPFIILLVTPFAGPWNEKHQKQCLMFLTTFCIWFGFLFLAFLSFDLSYVLAFVRDLTQWYTGAWIDQQTPFLLMELERSFSTESYYFGLGYVGFINAILVISCLLKWFKTKDRKLLMLGIAYTIALGCLFYIASRRLSQGTMIEVSLFLFFTSVVMMFYQFRNGMRSFSFAAFVGILVVSGLSVSLGKPGIILGRLSENSETALQFEKYLSAYPGNPVVYYMKGLPQPIIFPSANLIGALTASSNSDVQNIMMRYFPDIKFSNPEDGPILTPHIAVVPEYLDVLKETEEARSEWPQMWPKVEVFSPYPDFLKGLPFYDEQRCRVFQFKEVQSREHLVYFSVYRTKVTVCVISP